MESISKQYYEFEQNDAEKNKMDSNISTVSSAASVEII